MAFKKLIAKQFTAKDPQDLFRDIKNRTATGLLDHQSIIIENYMNNYYNSKNVALELPTGSGKTLVGLLIGEYRRLKENIKVVYICTTVQLVNQVVEQSKEKYGIKTTAFTGSIREYSQHSKSNYNQNKTIAVTTYKAFFNNNTFFNDADLLIFDDAHSAEDYISDFWSVNINRYDNETLYLRICEILKSEVDDNIYSRMTKNTPVDNDLMWCDKLPMHKLLKKSGDLAEAIDVNIDKKNSPAWNNISSYMHACNIYISYNSIYIRPIIPPTDTFEPFKRATQRLYMSATLGESGELERVTGVDHIDRVSLPEELKKQSIGRRFFIFPKDKLDSEQTRKLVIDLAQMVDRSVMLVPNNNKAESLKDMFKEDTNLKIYSNEDISKTKERFINDSNAVAVLANRFDGIDFVDDECRLMFIVGLQKVVNLQEKFFTTRLSSATLFNERIRTRITQAIGRCTRRTIDYSAVCIIGDDIEKELSSPNKLKLYHPELQAEIAFGHEQSTDIDGIKENFDLFMQHSDDWDEAEAEILAYRDSLSSYTNPDFESLQKAAVHEVRYQYAIWKKDYESALAEVKKILDNVTSESLQGYRGFWNYIASNICNELNKNGIDKTIPRDQYLQNAIRCTKSITWLNDLKMEFRSSKSSEVCVNDIYNSILVEGLELSIDNIKPKRRNREKAISHLTELLNSRGVTFEEGVKKLGNLIGFEAMKIDKPGSPDPFWKLGNKLCFISECKILDKEDNPINAGHIREAATHKTWLLSNGYINDIDEIITVIITNSRYLHKDAVSISSGIYYIHIDDLKDYAKRVFEIIETLHNDFIEVGNLDWRNSAIRLLNTKNITVKNILDKIKSQPIKNIEIKG